MKRVIDLDNGEQYIHISWCEVAFAGVVLLAVPLLAALLFWSFYNV